MADQIAWFRIVPNGLMKPTDEEIQAFALKISCGTSILCLLCSVIKVARDAIIMKNPLASSISWANSDIKK